MISLDVVLCTRNDRELAQIRCDADGWVGCFSMGAAQVERTGDVRSSIRVTKAR